MNGAVRVGGQLEALTGPIAPWEFYKSKRFLIGPAIDLCGLPHLGRSKTFRATLDSSITDFFKRPSRHDKISSKVNWLSHHW